MKDEGPKVFKLVFKLNSALDFLKKNNSWANTLQGIIFDNYYWYGVFKLLPW